MSITAAQARTTLTAMRVALGVGSVLAPRVVGRVMGLDPKASPVFPLPAKLYGACNLAIAAALVNGDEREQQRWLRYGVAIDMFDVAAVLGGGSRGYLSKRAVVLGSATALKLAILGLLAQRDT